MPVSCEREAQRHLALVLAQPLDRQPDPAPLGELDGVAAQVEQHLAQAARVAPDPRGHLVVHLALEVQALLVRHRRQQRPGLVRRHPQVERQALQLELARLDPREVQRVVHQVEQRLARVEQHLDHAPLVAVQLRLEQQVGHAHHAVHRACGARASWSPAARPWPAPWRGPRPARPSAARRWRRSAAVLARRPGRVRPAGAGAAGAPARRPCRHARGTRARRPDRRADAASACRRVPVTASAALRCRRDGRGRRPRSAGAVAPAPCRARARAPCPRRSCRRPRARAGSRAP